MKIGATTNVKENEKTVSRSMQVNSEGVITNRIEANAVHAAPTKLIDEQVQNGSFAEVTTF